MHKHASAPAKTTPSKLPALEPRTSTTHGHGHLILAGTCARIAVVLNDLPACPTHCFALCFSIVHGLSARRAISPDDGPSTIRSASRSRRLARLTHHLRTTTQHKDTKRTQHRPSIRSAWPHFAPFLRCMLGFPQDCAGRLAESTLALLGPARLRAFESLEPHPSFAQWVELSLSQYVVAPPHSP
jgi:hypothetical protein